MMLFWLGTLLVPHFGPFRLLESHGFLMFLGIYGGFFLTFILLPKFFARLPHDRGKDAAIQGALAKGKPTGAGIVFISIFTLVSILTVPFGISQLLVVVLTFLAMISGYVDDRSTREWGEYLKGLMDLVLAFGASLVIWFSAPVEMWFPFTNAVVSVPAWIFLPVSTLIIWISVNSTNCSDGVDGLSGTLIMVALISLGAILYFVLGNAKIADYLLLPHNVDGAKWAIMIFTLAGCLGAYLWFNAFPSSVLMGDAGSRALGFFLGVMVMVSGNPFLIFIIATVLLVNGGTGLLKVALLRFLKIRILHNVRFPLHDHVRQTRNWSNAQVLLKFLIVQVLITMGMFGIFLKIR